MINQIEAIFTVSVSNIMTRLYFFALIINHIWKPRHAVITQDHKCSLLIYSNFLFRHTMAQRGSECTFYC